MTNKQKSLWVEMATITAPLCAGDGPGACKVPHSCCDIIYCEMAMEIADKLNEPLTPTGNIQLPLMGPHGCIAPPHVRPLCSLHVCCISGAGFNSQDQEWTKKYFKLRNKLRMV